MKPKLDASPRDGSTPNAGRRIVCAKFRAGPHPPPHSPAVTHAVASGVGAGEDRAEAGGWWRRPSRDASAMETFGKKDGRTAFGANSEGSTSRDKLGMGMGEEDEGSVWIIMDMLNDTAFDDFLRVLHRHAPTSCSSSFIARLLSTTEGSTPEVGYVFPPPGGSPYNVSPGLPGSAPRTSATTLTNSPHRKVEAVPDPKSSPYSGKAGVPYPEWRHTVVQRARRAGIGPIGRAMELVIFGSDDGDESPPDGDDLLSYLEMPQDQESPVVSPKRPTLAKGSSMDSHVNLSPTLWRDYLNDDSDSDSEGESEESEQEWEGWMADIPRQRRIQADTVERQLRHLTPDIEDYEDEDDSEIPWIQDEPVSDDAAGVPASDDGAADEPAFSMDERTTGKSRWDLFPQSRTITTYSSADSLIRKSIRPSRSRPRILGGSKSMAGVEFPSVRARSPLSSQVRASDDLSTSPGSGTSPPSRSGLPVRIPIPIRMRMTSVRGTQVEIGTSPPETATSRRLPSFLRKGAPTNESAPASQDTSPSQEKSQKLPAGPAPPSLVLTIPEPQTSGSSPSSLESIKFVTPDSEDGGD
ncbi:hypothetical protein DAEQUDRAFT_133815 [Daedalea quercina L-15889]|uniref:Uncharacterized protein n=1 Tax=Daedalea quercina L-15889 TaxID=1314783 RepID=A0A165KPM6_9APHY|nr:hypothetical protein DAEQUDRAFT_133815 [Daedalea quercina L-15889]